MNVVRKLAYTQELSIQCHHARNAVNAIQESRGHLNSASKGSKEYILYYEEVFRNIQSFLTHAGNVSKLFWPPGPTTQAKVERKEYLTAEYGLLDNHCLNKRSLRNHLEHYDERLDAWLEKGHDFITADLLMDSSSGQLEKANKEEAMRWYDPNTALFYFQGECFNLEEMLQALKSIDQKTDEILAKPWITEDGDELEHGFEVPSLR